METQMNTEMGMLIELLEAIKNLLTWIVRDSGLIREEFRGRFMELLAEIQQRIDAVIERLNSVERGDPVYEELRVCGLTGNSLRMKAGVGRVLFKELDDSAEQTSAGLRIFGRNLKFPLKWVNSLLGSLAKVFPPLEAVKEFKEHVELTLEEKQSDPTWGYDPIFPGLK
jgi:hypothetical protein